MLKEEEMRRSKILEKSRIRPKQKPIDKVYHSLTFPTQFFFRSMTCMKEERVPVLLNLENISLIKASPSWDLRNHPEFLFTMNPDDLERLIRRDSNMFAGFTCSLVWNIIDFRSKSVSRPVGILKKSNGNIWTTTQFTYVCSHLLFVILLLINTYSLWRNVFQLPSPQIRFKNVPYHNFVSKWGC